LSLSSKKTLIGSLSLGAQIARDLIGSGNTLVNGAAMSLFAVVAGLVAVLARRWAPSSAMVFGGAAATTGMGLLVLSSSQRSLPIFLAAIAAAGVGYSLLFLGGLNLINANLPIHHRGGTLSAVLFVAYLMQGVIAPLLGAVATAWGLKMAIDLGSAVISVFSMMATLACGWRPSILTRSSLCPCIVGGQRQTRSSRPWLKGGR
jgi:MFS family permease